MALEVVFELIKEDLSGGERLIGAMKHHFVHMHKGTKANRPC